MLLVSGLLVSLLGLQSISACTFDPDWQPWTSCSRSCGGGTQHRVSDCFWGSDERQDRDCNKFCRNGGKYYSGLCHCSPWRTGRCCERCRHTHIDHCIGENKQCGGSPDNIRCTKCSLPYTPAGYGKGCRRLLCTEENGGCDHTCLMERGLAKCVCRSGFKLSSNGYTCTEIDECTAGIAHCDHHCTNTVGSYTCSCRIGYTLDSDSHTCSDVDECLTTSKCEHICINTKGSFHCSCRQGFTLSSDGKSCSDINECERGNGGCESNCVNEPGSFHCSCNSGYRLGLDSKQCTDIDECAEAISRCSQDCVNTPGNYTCECRHGFILQDDNLSCKDIDDCEGVTCLNGGSCMDNIGSFTCSCMKGFTGKLCENDIDECLGFLHGGCEDTCTNTVGSFHCSCSGNTTLNIDGFSCSGSGMTDSIFVRHSIVRQLLPRGCSSILLTRCKEGNTVDVLMSSTSPWYQLRSNSSIIYTFGIVFVEVNNFALPISITGIEITQHKGEFAILFGSLSYSKEDGVHYGEDRHGDCVSFETTPRDIYDFLTSSSFLKTIYNTLNDILPDWLSFSQNGTEILSVNDLHTDIVSGKTLQNGECRGAPVYENRLYTVLKFGSSFSLSLYGDEVVLPTALTNEQFCLIIDICQDYGGSIFLLIPKSSRDFLNSFNIFQRLKAKYGLEFRPVGLGISLFKHVNVLSIDKPLALWNGDKQFTYRVMPEANLWLSGGGSIVHKGNTVSVSAQADSEMFVSIPNVTNILKSIFLDEWDVLLKMNIHGSIDMGFRLFGRDQSISLNNILTSDIDAYASLGGQNKRILYGDISNPSGIFLSLMVDVNPFETVPILKDWVFDFNNKVFAYLETDPSLAIDLSKDKSIIDELLHFKAYVEIFLNTTLGTVARYSSILVDNSVKLMENLNATTQGFVKAIAEFIKECELANGFQNLIDKLSNVWSKGWKKLQGDTRLFLDSIENQTAIAKYNFSNLLTKEVDVLKHEIQNIGNIFVQQALSVYKEFQGFGIKYKGTLKIFHIKIVGLEIEIVYSRSHLAKCSRFSKVYEAMQNDRSFRVLAVLSTGIFKIAPFLRMNAGAGVGIAFSIDTPNKMLAQLHAEANLLGISASADVFLSENGHSFHVKGKLWNTFKAVINVSFENNLDTGVVDMCTIKGRFVANAGDGDSFGDSYWDAARKLIRKTSDWAQKRIGQVQKSFTSAQNSLTDAQDWLESKKAVVRHANVKFDDAIESLEHAKQTLEDAKRPFRNAMSKLNAVQRKVDKICRIKHCRRICVPGIKCRICWKKLLFVKIPLPCCHFTNCMFSFPDPICVTLNLGCRALRGIAYIALEAAKLFVRIPMLALDAAKLVLSGAQFIVDKSRVVLDIAIAALDMAQIGLEGAKLILEREKLALEAVKKVVGWGLKAIEYIVKYGFQSIIDVKNCGFEMKTSVYDLTVFRVSCEINLFRLGFRKVEIGINFGNHEQSIWQAAKGSIDAFVENTEQHQREKREIKSFLLSGMHKVIRKARDADMDSDDFDLYMNETIDAVFKTSGFKNNTHFGDYENRVELFKEKCSISQKSINFFSEAIQVLIEMSGETANTLNNVSSIEDELAKYNMKDITSNFTIENMGVNTDAAFKDFNISVEDIDGALEDVKGNLSSDPLLSGIDEVSSDARMLLQNQTDDANNMKVLQQWIISMANMTQEYFTDDDCVSFVDCAHFAVFQLYGIFDAENVTNRLESLEEISLLEDLFLELTGNVSHTVTEIYDLAGNISDRLISIGDLNVFCSNAPKILSNMGNQTIKRGETLHIICNVTGEPKPTIWWYHNDEFFTEQTDITLVVRNVSQAGMQRYRCVAGNLVANLTSEYANVIVTDDAPETVRDNTPESAEHKTRGSSEGGSGVKEEKVKSSSDVPVIIGATASAFILVVCVGVAVAWWKHHRKQIRKMKAPGSRISLNSVRPEIAKPLFTRPAVMSKSSKT